MNESARVSVAETAKLLGVSALTVQYLLRDGLVDFGVALKRDGSTKYTYIIFRKKLEEYMNL